MGLPAWLPSLASQAHAYLIEDNMLKDARVCTVRGCAPACRLSSHRMLSHGLSLGAIV